MTSENTEMNRLALDTSYDFGGVKEYEARNLFSTHLCLPNLVESYVA